MEKFFNHIKKLKVKVFFNKVKKINLTIKPFKLFLDNNKKITCDCLIIATGSSPKKLGLKNENKLIGKGISYCAICDGYFYKNKIVAVIGGGNSAVEYSIYLANICKKVFLIYRNNKLKIEPLLFIKLNKYILNKKILCFKQYIIVKINETKFNKIKIKINNNLHVLNINIDGLFIAIGNNPNIFLFKNQLKLNKYFNTIKTFPNVNSSTKTSIKGVFACGDVIDNIYKQAITAASSGCMAALDAYNYLIK